MVTKTIERRDTNDGRLSPIDGAHLSHISSLRDRHLGSSRIGPHPSAIKPDGVRFERKCEQLDQLFQQVRAGRGGSLVLQGKPGVGKTTLLDQAIETAPDLRIVRVFGVKAEKGLPYAAIHQLCRQLDGAERLPRAQAEALGAAFGVCTASSPDPSVLGLAVHSLLAQTARQRPVVCVVDDAHWLDDLSARTLGFVGRRLAGLPVGLILALPQITGGLGGLPCVEIRGFSPLEARSLMERVIPGPLDMEVRARMVSETEGSPLALVKLMTPLRLATIVNEFDPAATAVPEALHQRFRRRLQELSEDTRLFLLVAATEPLGRPSVLWRAADVLGIPAHVSRGAEAQGLLQLSAPVRFRHPLWRAMVYEAASPADRRRAHQALAEATDATTDPDRRLWHLGRAASRPDEQLAAEVEQAAVRARVGGGWIAAAPLLEQAAMLTPDPARRMQRILSAVEAKLAAGALEDAVNLLARVDLRLLGKESEPRLERLRAEVVVAQGGSDAPALLLDAATRLEAVDSQTARETYLEAFEAALETGRFHGDAVIVKVAEAVRRGATNPQPAHAVNSFLDGWVALVREGPAAAIPVLKGALRSLKEEKGSKWLSLGGVTALNLWDDGMTSSLTKRQRDLSLQAGALIDHQRSLVTLARLSILAGDFAGADDLVQQALLIRPAGPAKVLNVPLMLAAFRGQEAAALELIDSAVQQATLHGESRVLAFAECMAAVLHNGLGQYRMAFMAADRAAECHEFGLSDFALAELIEAAVRCGEREAGEAAFQRLSDMTSLAGTDWALGVEACAQALLSEGQAAEELYRKAVDLLGRCSISTALARAHLLFGEWLRRESRRVEARQQLRIALQMFTAMGAEAFAERAQREMLATGERLQGRGAEASAQLTPQESQISRMARDGHTNPEIAAKLYISRRTVEYHLRKVFRKLGISSRIELHRALPA
jgi:DNA-binding CsgD family transcriptional regulator